MVMIDLGHLRRAGRGAWGRAPRRYARGRSRRRRPIAVPVIRSQIHEERDGDQHPEHDYRSA